MLYPKINTLWKRDSTHKIIEGEYSSEVFKNIIDWTVTEKIDGTNIRVSWDGATIELNGRTDNAQIPEHLLKKLQQLFTKKNMAKVFGEKTRVVLYGEGYGPKIQNGERYTDEVNFILFDALIDDWWLERKNIVDVAKKLNIEVVPEIKMTGYADSLIKQCASLLRQTKHGYVASQINLTAEIEGIVATANPLVLFRDGTPVKFKLKIKDYRDLK